ncbi:MAG TPA: PAS domain S-box protein [Bryobacteraceae bacterium]|nr:PAS domain S-box protein [Bryobacteraceae bacterium]
MDRIRVLLVEDNPGDARLLREVVREAEGAHIQLTHVDTLSKALSKLDADQFDVVMLDLSLPDADGLETLVRTHAQAPSVPIVVLTGLDDEKLAIKAVREGAQDYLVKGQVTGQLLVRAMRYATERKRAVEALQRSEEYFRSLIENALDIITVLDMDGSVRYGSPSFERMLGYPHGALTGENLFRLVHPEDRERVHGLLEVGAQHPGATHSIEFRVLHRKGAWRVLEAIGKRFERESSVAGFVLNSRDITERKRSEEAVRHANETLRAVIDTSPLAIYTLDLEGVVRTWNSSAQQMFGYTREEAIGQPLPMIFPEEGPEFRDRLTAVMAGESQEGKEERRRAKDGEGIDVSYWNAPLRDADGAVTGLVEMVADNTERKRLEEQFRQVQKMEAVGRLAGGVAHDFNNLLTVITGYCQMLLERFPEGDQTREDMQQVLKAADRATTLTRQLLAFSRKQIVQPKVIELGALVADMQQMLKRLLGVKIDLALEIDPTAGKVRVDPGQLEQVIVNLVVNARDAMPDGGTLAIRLQNRFLEAESGTREMPIKPGTYVVLEVSDTGTGMTDEVRSHLFEPFFTTKEKGRGTGLGLSTSYGIVKQNHGEIEVRSELGHGSTFSIFLPRIDEPPTPEPVGHSGEMPERGAETILVAEDEDGVRHIVTQMLREQGYTVLPASGGAEALQIAQNHTGPVQLLLSDVMMPRMSGPELAQRLRGLRPDIRVLFVSGYADSEIVREGELEPNTDFLQKPFTREQLANKVREVLRPGHVAGEDMVH